MPPPPPTTSPPPPKRPFVSAHNIITPSSSDPRPSSPTPSNASSKNDFFTPPPRFDPDEEAKLLTESSSLRAQANTHYTSSRYAEAIQTYDRALASCPSYLHYDVAVLRSNIAAAHIKLGEWKAAVEAAGKAVEALGVELPSKAGIKEEGGRDGTRGDDGGKGDGKEGKGKGGKEGEEGDGQGGRVVEIEEEDEGEVEKAVERLNVSDQRRRQVEALRAKSLMRRAKGNFEMGGWGSLSAAEEDYKLLATMSVLPPVDQKFVRQQLAVLPARMNQAKERETAEMMEKLKELGNGILKPFGLSTDMFKFQKDDNTGGYNMSFGNG